MRHFQAEHGALFAGRHARPATGRAAESGACKRRDRYEPLERSQGGMGLVPDVSFASAAWRSWPAARIFRPWAVARVNAGYGI